MIFAGKEELTHHLNGMVSIPNGSVRLENADKLTALSPISSSSTGGLYN